MSARADRDVVFITYSGLPDGDPDDLLCLKLLGEDLAKSGCKGTVLDWRKTSVSQLADTVVVVRSTWDYHLSPDEFLKWLQAVSEVACLCNSLQLIAWNINKKYLLDLQAAGLAVVPTVHLTQAQAAVFDEKAWRKLSDFDAAHAVIVKPAIGLSTFGVKKFATTSGDVVGHVNKLGQGGDVLIQPYLNSVEAYGERSLIFIGGAFSHSVRKSAFQKLAAAGEAGETTVEASENEIAFGKATLAALGKIKPGSVPLYARVDIVRDHRDKLLLLELELIEPSLFLAMDKKQEAPRLLAAAILDLF